MVVFKATAGFEPADKGFADLCLTTWLRRRSGFVLYHVFVKGQIQPFSCGSFMHRTYAKRQNPPLSPPKGREVLLRRHVGEGRGEGSA